MEQIRWVRNDEVAQQFADTMLDGDSEMASWYVTLRLSVSQRRERGRFEKERETAKGERPCGVNSNCKWCWHTITSYGY